MQIRVKDKPMVHFKEIKWGDLFSKADGGLFIKTRTYYHPEFSHDINCVNLENGKANWCSEEEWIYPVNGVITIEE